MWGSAPRNSLPLRREWRTLQRGLVRLDRVGRCRSKDVIIFLSTKY